MNMFGGLASLSSLPQLGLGKTGNLPHLCAVIVSLLEHSR